VLVNFRIMSSALPPGDTFGQPALPLIQTNP
jgi:hypothetical protein